MEDKKLNEVIETKSSRIEKIREEIEYEELRLELAALKRPPLRERVLNLIRELEPIKKMKKGEGGAIYAHYTHNDVQQAVMSLLPKHMIFMNSMPEYNKDTGIMTMTLIFEDPYGAEVGFEKTSIVTVGNIKDEKGFGSAMSYSMKYGLMQMFGLGGENDADDLAKSPVKEYEPRLITPEQLTQILSLIKDVRDPNAMKEYIMKAFKLKNLTEIQAKDFDMIVKGIRGRIAKEVAEPQQA